jgi:hypothetical protein
MTDMPRDQYVEWCKHRALGYLDQGDLVKAITSIITTMNARPDCQLPEHLTSLAYSLLLANDALGLKALIEELK